MGLFQKKEIPITTKLYSIGAQETILVVGLGNVGAKYDQTRHNFGFLAIDDFAATNAFNPWIDKKDLKAILCAQIIHGKKVILCKPTTFMNLSGEAVQLVQHFYKISGGKTVVVYDELDLPLGSIRTGQGGTAAGHNGIKSLISHSDNTFWRIRLGVGPKEPAEIDSADFVLQKFSTMQSESIKLVINETASLLNDYFTGTGKPNPETRKVL